MSLEKQCRNTQYVYHFCYGSNLLRARLQNTCPNAKRVGIGYAPNFEVVFGKHFSKRWNGCVATIQPRMNTKTWGCVWRIPLNEIHLLDDQEAVHRDIYNTIYIPVIMRKSTKAAFCYTYQLTDLPGRNIARYRPSSSYLDVILKGAKECKLPSRHILYLKKFKATKRKSSEAFPKV